MSTYTQETQYKLRELNRVASPAPWRYVGDCDYMKAGVKLGDIVDAGGRVVVPESPYVLGGPFEREVIIQTRNALPALLTEIDRLTTRLSISEARLGRVATSHPEAYLTALGGGKE